MFAGAKRGSGSSFRGPNAGVEVLRRLLHRDDGDVVRKDGVERLGGVIGGRASLDVDARDLPERVHTGVGAPGDREHQEDLGERPAHLVLDGSPAGLRGPAGEVGAVVLERQPELHSTSSVRS